MGARGGGDNSGWGGSGCGNVFISLKNNNLIEGKWK
jgi:hypothetical protein